MAGLKDYKYKVITKFFSPTEITLLKSYCKNKLFENTWVTDDQCPFTPMWPKDPLMNALLESKLNVVESYSGLKLFKSYSYWRYYVFGSILRPHYDRPSCEISITACIHKTAMWPFVVDDKLYDLEEGDAILYLGCEVSHCRYDYFNGDGLAQVFLHYVDQEGPFTHHKNDEYLNRTKRTYSEMDKQICEQLKL
tara:strand:- start:1130 stop:1711 length:582 start_codon:yes stop_codon:yes gene_type:complete